MEERLGDVRRRAHRAEQNDLALELALPLVEVGGVLNTRYTGLAGDGPVGRRRPGSGLHPERLGVGRDHPRPGVDLLPAHAEVAPVLEVRVLEADLGQRVAGPGIGLGHVGRAGEPRADAVGERVAKLHHLAVLEALVANPRIHGEVDVFGRRLRTVVGRSDTPSAAAADPSFLSAEKDGTTKLATVAVQQLQRAKPRTNDIRDDPPKMERDDV